MAALLDLAEKVRGVVGERAGSTEGCGGMGETGRRRGAERIGRERGERCTGAAVGMGPAGGGSHLGPPARSIPLPLLFSSLLFSSLLI